MVSSFPADVTPIGVVTTGDSQPVELREWSNTVPVATQGSRPCLVAHKGEDFAAALGFVGTERIGASTTHQWLERYSKANHALTLVEFGHSLAAELSVLWAKYSYDTCLWIFANHVAQYRSPGESPLQTLTHHMAL